MGRAGAIVSGNAGICASKRVALERAGVVVVGTPHEIPDAVSSGLTRRFAIAVPGRATRKGGKQLSGGRTEAKRC